MTNQNDIEIDLWIIGALAEIKAMEPDPRDAEIARLKDIIRRAEKVFDENICDGITAHAMIDILNEA